MTGRNGRNGRSASWLAALLILVGLAPAASAAPVSATGPDLTVGLKTSDIDLAACKAWVDGEEAKGDFKDGILTTLGVAQGKPWSAIHYSLQQKAQVIQYLVVLKRPVKFGALLVQKNARLQYLKPGAALPPDPTQAESWVEVNFPPNQSGWRLATVTGESQAFLCTLTNDRYGWYPFTCLRLMKPRLHNIVPDAVANGEAEYTSTHQFSPPRAYKAANVVTGADSWRSHGPVGNDGQGRVPRPQVSDVEPTWFVVSWDEPRTVSGLLLSSNFKSFKVYAFEGAAGINPATAGRQDWKRIKQEPRAGGGGALVTFPPLTTRGLRIVADATNKTSGDPQAGPDKWGMIDGLQVFTDLGDAPVPPPKAAGAAPPFEIAVTLPEKGIVSMAIDDAQGRRIRTLPARVEMDAGKHTVRWDLKDDAGAVVPPGSYAWKAITHPGLALKYQMTPFPNVEMITKENSPWLNGASGAGGWLADHAPPQAVCAAGDDRVFLSAPVCESGVGLLECDLDGRKYWGHHNIIAWTTPSFLASDGKNLYCMPQSKGHFELQGQMDLVWRFSLPEKKFDTPFELPATATRRRGPSGLAVRDGKLYIAVNAGADWMENAFAVTDVDQDNCEPKYAKPPKSALKDRDPDRRADFLRLFRLTQVAASHAPATGTPPGYVGLTYLETAKQPASRQHIVVALQREAPVGSFAFPLPETKDLQMIVSVLKPGAAYPPNPTKEADWTRIYAGKGKGWTVVPAPENTLTRAVRLSFDMGLDELDEAVLGDEGEPDLDGGLGAGDAEKKSKAAWQARLEGMKILRRRFENLFPSCTVTVNSGTVTPEGEWDAHRDTPLTADRPGIYMMQWKEPQKIRGLAIKEIDGRFTEIDAWTAAGPPDMQATQGWETLATYEQKLRYYYVPDQNHNSKARYIDGYVDFGRDVTTRAIRLRVKEQWMWKEKDRAGVVGVRQDRGGMDLDPARCRIYGVAPLQALGGEPPVDALANERIEVYDLATKKLVQEIPFAKGGDIAFAADGTLYGISDGRVVRIDTEGGKHAPLPLDVRRPTAIACDKAGELFVYDAAADARVIRVFDTAGKPLRTIGTPGGRVAGPHDPTRFTNNSRAEVDLAVDGKDQLWVVECEFPLKRVSVWGVDGTFKKDLLGNTGYGGGGCLDPVDKSRVFFDGLEFAVDWKTGATALKNVLYCLGDDPRLGGEVGGEGTRVGTQPIQLKDRLYLVTRPFSHYQPVGIVALYEKNRLKRVAAMGEAGKFPMLRTTAILEKLGRKPLGDCAFVWSDRSGDGFPQPDEVEFFDLPEKRTAASPCSFDDTLGVDATDYRYEVREILPNGTPVYERKKKAFNSLSVRMNDGRFFLVGSSPMAAVDDAGKASWTHPVEPWGVQSIAKAKRPWYPGQAVAQFDVIGHETATEGDLGEFFVTNGNASAWHIWTADGLLAANIFRDHLHPGGRPWSMTEHARGMDLTDVLIGQEHFGGSFCKTRADGKYYVVAGHNHISVVEVQGIEKFKRLGAPLAVTAQDVDAAVEWDRTMQTRRLYEAAKIIECRKRKGGITLDGNPDEWDFSSATLEDRDATLSLAYDDAHLYACFEVRHAGPFKNSGEDWRRFFKTGAAVDLQIGLDPKADIKRHRPAPGDSRLLMTMAGKTPTVVLYQPTAPDAKPEEAWESHTGTAHSGFDRVVKLEGVRLAARGDATGYCVEAAIPLQALGLKIVPEVPYKFDWGILVSGPDGNEVTQRAYWANPETGMLADEAIESMIHPQLWGLVRFTASAGGTKQPELAAEKSLAGGDDDDFDLDDE